MSLISFKNGSVGQIKFSTRTSRGSGMELDSSVKSNFGPVARRNLWFADVRCLYRLTVIRGWLRPSGILVEEFGSWLPAARPLKKGLIGCPETSLTNYWLLPRNIPEERTPQLHCGSFPLGSGICVALPASAPGVRYRSCVLANHPAVSS